MVVIQKDAKIREVSRDEGLNAYVIPTGRLLEEKKECLAPMSEPMTLGYDRGCLSPSADSDSNRRYSCGTEFVVFGFLFLWYTLNWEAMIWGHVDHFFWPKYF